jgi:hypothetical protein
VRTARNTDHCLGRMESLKTLDPNGMAGHLRVNTVMKKRNAMYQVIIRPTLKAKVIMYLALTRKVTRSDLGRETGT